MLSRRQVLGGLLAAGAAGCASSPNSTVDLFSKTLGKRRPSPGEYPLTADQIHNIPYATLGVRVDEQPRAVMVLVSINGPVLQWVSADQVIFETGNGRLLRTRGLKRDLVDSRWNDDPLAGVAGSGAAPARGVYREIDVGREQAVAVDSSFRVVGTETLSILGRQHTVYRVDERADVRSWRWQARNTYWIDTGSGRIWRSLQQYCPETPPIELELLKPAAV